MGSGVGSGRIDDAQGTRPVFGRSAMFSNHEMQQ